MLGLAASLAKGGASLLTYVKDNLKLYLDFKSSRSDTLKFPSEGSTSFDGNDFISCGNSSDFPDNPDGEEFTITAWVNCSVGSDGTIFSKADTSNRAIQLFTNTDDTLSGFVGGTQLDSSTVVADGTWHHVVLRSFNDGGTYKGEIYIDGVFKVVGTSGTTTATDRDFLIGARRASSNTDTGYLLTNSSICNVGLWNRALSLEEVQSVMNKSYSQLGSVEKTSLVSWWALDNTDYMGANVSTFMNSTGSSIGEWDLTDGIITVSSHNAYRYFNAYVNAPTYSGANAYIRFEVTAKKTSGSPQLDFEGKTFFDLTTEYQTYTVDVIYENTSGDNFFRTPNASATDKVLISSFNAYPFGSKDSHGSNNGVNSKTKATTSVYGGNAPILPRAIDIAESQAEAIGNGSASFNGSSDYVEVADSQVLQTNDDMTISAWIYVTGTTDGVYKVIAMKRDSGGTNYQFYLSNEASPKLRFWDGSSATSSTSAITKNEWNHVAVSIQDGVTNGTVFYINGIADGTATFNISSDDSPLFIGKHSTSDTYWSGNISQLGIWQGALSQSQVQSLMESTSYAKIPASVKSTLGSELVTSITNSSSNPWETFSGASGNTLASATNDAGTSGEMFSQQLGLSANTLVKVTVTVTLNAGTIKAQFCASDGSYTVGDLNEVISSSGTHSFYAIISHADKDQLWIKHQISPLDISNLTLSVKEVTNDIVAYYPLDADSSNTSNGVGITSDSVNGETLGSNLVDANTSSGWFNNSDSSTITNITDGVSVADDSGFSDIGYFRDSSILSTDLTVGKLYKVQVDAYHNGVATIELRIRDGSANQLINLTTNNTTYTRYIVAQSTTGGSIRTNNHASNSIAYLTNLSIKEVTSNTGVLK